MTETDNLQQAVIAMTKLTPDERGRLIALTIRHAIECGDIEASTIRTMLSKIESGR